MEEQIIAMKQKAKTEINQAQNQKQLQDLRVQYLGKKGELTVILRSMGNLSKEERPKIGSYVNEARDELEQNIQARENEIKRQELEKRLKTEKLDVTMPGKKISLGSVHPITQIIGEVKEIFIGLRI